jgi:hypothetical protein
MDMQKITTIIWSTQVLGQLLVLYPALFLP